LSPYEVAAARQELAAIPLPGNAKFSEGTEVAKVYNKRFTLLVEAFSDLEVDLLEAEIIWGEEIKDAVLPLKMTMAKLHSRMSQYIEIQTHPGMEKDMTEEEVEVMNDVLHKIGGDLTPNPFSREVSNAIKTIEEFLRQHLKL